MLSSFTVCKILSQVLFYLIILDSLSSPYLSSLTSSETEGDCGNNFVDFLIAVQKTSTYKPCCLPQCRGVDGPPGWLELGFGKPLQRRQLKV